MKNRILVIFLFLISMVSCKHDKVALFGDSYILNRFVEDNINSDFVFSKMTSKNLYNYLDSDALSLTKGNKISSILNRSNKVILSFGIYDLISLLDFSNKEIIYKKEFVESKLELMDYYVNSSFQIIKESIKQNCKVFVLKQYNPLIYNFENLDDFEFFLAKVNNILSLYSFSYHYSFIEIENYEDYLLDDFILDVSIKDKFFEKMH